MEAPPLTAFQAAEREAGRLCPVCQTSIAPGEAIGLCPRCEAPFHVECWGENGGCAVYGCELVPQTVKASEAAPQTFWGQEEKDCPRCGQRIKAAALRCRHCGTLFDPGAPVSAGPPAIGDGAARSRLAAVSAVVFVAGIVPFTAPLSFVFGGLWYLRQRKQIAGLPSTYRVLAALGVIAAGAVTLVLSAAALLHGGSSAAEP